MNSDIKLGRIGGIPIGLNMSWFLIFALVTFTLANGLFSAAFPRQPDVLHWILGALTSLLFFGSVLLHELGHAYAARKSGIQVCGITLFIFGGVAVLDQDSRTPEEEFRIAIAGPVVSLALAASFGALYALSGAGSIVGVVSLWLGNINLTLALFNLIPGFPLDGGRVLKAVVWAWTRSPDRATQIAAASGSMVAFGFMGYGLWTVMTGSLFDGLWMLMIGWFLRNAAAESVMQSRVQRALAGVHVRDVMNDVLAYVTEQTPLRYLVEMQALRRGLSYFLVGDADRSTGLVTLSDIAAVPQRDWARVSVQQIMTPWEHVKRIAPDANLLAALREMERAHIEHLPVTEGGRVIGILTREGIIRHMRVRAALI